MNKICFINGSPKTGESCSLYMIDYISKALQDNFKEISVVNALKLLSAPNKEEVFEDILCCDAIVVVFPLYIDSLPSSLLEMLEDLDLYKKQYPQITSHISSLYGLVNCGFIDGFQNINALKILENYSVAVGFKWCGGIGLGGGEMIRSTKDQMPLQSKMALPIYNALCSLTRSIASLEIIAENNGMVFGNHKFPQWLFIIMANNFWSSPSKANGVAKKMMYAKPHLIRRV